MTGRLKGRLIWFQRGVALITLQRNRGGLFSVMAGLDPAIHPDRPARTHGVGAPLGGAGIPAYGFVVARGLGPAASLTPSEPKGAPVTLTRSA